MTKLKLVLALSLLSVFSKSFAQPGGKDISFAGQGLQTYSFKQNVSSDELWASAADAAGNLYLTGVTLVSGTQPYIAKLLPSGKPDLTFGVGGKKILTDISPFYTFLPRAIALYTDGSGSIVLAGSMIIEGTYTPCIVKLNANGTIQGMGTKGTDPYVAYSDLVVGTEAMFSGVHVLANGDIIAAGDKGQNSDIIICRLTSAGLPKGYGATTNDKLEFGLADPYYAKVTCSAIKGNILYVAGNTGTNIAILALDYTTGDLSPTFAGGSSQVLTVSGDGSPSANYCYAMAIDANGNINLGGSSDDPFFESKLLNYQIDKNGNFNFCKLYAAGGAPLEVRSMVVDPNNKIIMGGFTTGGDDNKTWTILRTKSDGTTDPSDDSFAKTYSLASNYGIKSMNRLSSDGSLLLAGSDNSDVLVKKISSSAAPVTTYGTNSETRLWFADAESYITDMVVRTDGKLLVTGSYYDVTKSSFIGVLALMTKDGVLDPSFGGTGGADPGTINISSIVAPVLRSHLELTAIQLQKDNQILLAGSYMALGEYMDAFLIRLSAAGVLDGGFNGSTGYAIFNMADSYIHDLAVQNDLKILAYGFMNRILTLVRYKADGTIDDAGFATNGIYTHPGTEYGGGTIFSDEKVELKIQPDDQKIVCVGTSFASGTDFLVFRLLPTGALDGNFGKNNDGIAFGDFGGNDYATSICLKPNGSIVAGGYTNNKYGVMQLTSTGLLDTNFGTLHTGLQTLGKNYTQRILNLEAENDNAILASGYMGTTDDGIKYITVLRITAAGLLDNTFSGRGEATFGRGYSKNGAISGSSYYVAGSNDYFGTAIDNGYYTGAGEMIKLKLGGGPVIKISTLQLTDLQKTFGDDPFPLTPVSNSPAPVQYSIDHGTCATVNATTGIVTIKCVPASPDQYIAIKAYQAAIPGFSEASAVVNLTVAKAFPTIIFNTQGGLIDSTILLRVVSNSTGELSFYVVENNAYALEDLGSGNISILGEGCGVVQVTVDESQNYLQGTATTSVCGYKTPIRPVAFSDYITVVYKQGVTARINVLANDESYTAALVKSEVDLDPSTDGIQNTFVSPAYGTFVVDTSGNLTYYPFEGFAGTGAIQYVIHDAQGLESLPGNINVTQTIPAHDLKATELFTPNRDGLNDAFVIGYVDTKKQNKLKVFDRNGQELLSLVDYRNDWTGELANGKQAENGIYYYVFQEGTGDNQRELKGVVELKR